MIRTLNELRKQMQELGLTRVEKEILTLSKQAFRLEPKKNDVNDSSKIGKSKFGGNPDLPKSISWPRWRQKPLYFLCQISLQDFEHSTIGFLPKKGFIYFFFAFEDENAYDSSSMHQLGSQVLFYDGRVSDLHRISCPSDLHPSYPFSERIINLKQEICFPFDDENACLYWWKEPMESEVFRIKSSTKYSIGAYQNLKTQDFSFKKFEVKSRINHLKFTKDELCNYRELLTRVKVRDSYCVYRFLGYPDQIQPSIMELECHTYSRKVISNNEALKTDETKNWQLLLQLCLDDPNWDSGNGRYYGFGKLYFWIHLQDMYQRDFSNIYVTYQTT